MVQPIQTPPIYARRCVQHSHLRALQGCGEEGMWFKRGCGHEGVWLKRGVGVAKGESVLQGYHLPFARGQRNAGIAHRVHHVNKRHASHRNLEQIWAHVHHRTHQQAPGRPPFDRKLRRHREPRLDQACAAKGITKSTGPRGQRMG